VFDVEEEMTMQDHELVAIRTDDLMVAFDAIAGKRLAAKCECEHDTGYTCRRCRRLKEDVHQRNIDLSWRYAQRLIVDARRRAADSR
jgi:hypothetical protein